MIVSGSAEERETQICRLGWTLLALWLVTVIYMTKEIWFGQTSIGEEEARQQKSRRKSASFVAESVI
ncbi:unnamed protein product [Caenorhabditis bovis]|uniref:Uncharacterized protein n=1 Tax=Caenorhabditis bovis TaxID=2654633 RepID=A0A8S1EVG4_9PELO|nr:unnamed protein product [Caenorhabditis bovis]